MTLGDLVRQFDDEDDAAAALDAIGDIVLFSAVSAMGERFGETPGAYVANAARRFAARASDEDWLGVMNAIERADEPARAALERMLRWALAGDRAEAGVPVSPACTCSGGGCHDHGRP